MEKTKVCNTCGRTLPITDFYVRNKSKDGRDYRCKYCSREYAQARRDNFPELTKEIALRTRVKNREKIRKREREKYAINKNDPAYMEKKREYYRNVLADKVKEKKRHNKEVFNNSKPPCAKCGETRGYVLQYHHIDPNTKEFSIGATCGGRKKVRLEAEVKKCVCLCANCHKEFHYLYGAKPQNPIEDIEEYLGKPIPQEQKDTIREYYGMSSKEREGK